MCGIAGEFCFNGQMANSESLQRMLSCIDFRGPDNRQTWLDGQIGFAHARLAIIDLSSAGSQPMVDSELDLVLVFNGVIYNYSELRSQLESYGYRFFSTSDSEVILKAYHRWQQACVEKLDGIFAFAIWGPTTKFTVPRSRPLGHQTALLHAHAELFSLRIKPASTVGSRRGQHGD